MSTQIQQQEGLHPEVGQKQNSGFMAGLKQLADTGTIADEVSDVMNGELSPEPSEGSFPETESEPRSLQSESEEAEGGEDDQGDEESQEGDESLEDGESGDGDSEEDEGEESSVETLVAAGKEIQVDWNDREPIKRAIQQAAAYKDEKVAKDRALNDLKTEKDAHKETVAELTQYKDEHTAIQEAKELGPEAVIKLLFNRDITEFQQEWAERESWSDEKKEAFAESMKAKQLEARIKRMEEQAAKEKEDAQKEREAARLAKVEANFNASYRKYSLDGAIGDQEIEDSLDDQMYNSVKAQFSGKDLDDIDPAEVDSAFKAARAKFLRVFRKTSDSQTEAAIQRKKTEALKSAQARAGSKTPKKTARDKFRQAASDANRGWRDILSNPELRDQL